MDAMQNPPLHKILASPNPLLSMAEYQGSVFGKYVKNTGSKMQQQERKIAVKSTRVNNLSDENKKLEETVTALSGQNETLQDAVTEAKLTTQKVEQRLCQAKSDLTKGKTTWNPRNVKQREQMKEKHISQLQNTLDKKSEEVKPLQEQIKIKETENVSLESGQKQLKEKLGESIKVLHKKVQKEKNCKLMAQKLASKWR